MTAEEVRALGHVSPRTLRRWHGAGLKPTKRGTYRRADVEKFLVAKRTGDTEQRDAQMNLALALAAENAERFIVLEAAHIPAATAREAWGTICQLSTARLAALPAELLPVVLAHADASPGTLRASLAAHIRVVLLALAAMGEEGPPARRVRHHLPRRNPKTTLESARVQLAESKTRLSEARRQIATGAWRCLDDVTGRLDDKVLEVRAALLALANTWAPRLGAAAQQGEAAVRALLEQAIGDASRALVGDPL